MVLEFFRPDRGLPPSAVRLWVKLAARIFARRHVAAYDYLADSIAETVSADEFSAMAGDADLAEVRRRAFPPATTCAVFRKR